MTAYLELPTGRRSKAGERRSAHRVLSSRCRQSATIRRVVSAGQEIPGGCRKGNRSCVVGERLSRARCGVLCVVPRRAATNPRGNADDVRADYSARCKLAGWPNYRRSSRRCHGLKVGTPRAEITFAQLWDALAPALTLDYRALVLCRHDARLWLLEQLLQSNRGSTRPRTCVRDCSRCGSTAPLTPHRSLTLPIITLTTSISPAASSK